MSITVIQGVPCYGDMSEDAFVNLACEWSDGEDFDQCYSGSKGFTTWTELVAYYVQGGLLEGYTVLECESDE